jgi:hypothetical protein
MGIKFCKFNNNHVVENCDIVFLCIAPHQIRYIIDDLRGRIKPNVLIYSLVLGFPALKLASLLQHDQFLKPSYQLNESLDHNESLWPISDDIESILGNDLLMKKLSLENEDQIDSLVRDDQFVPVIFFALLNILKRNALLNRTQSLRVLSALLFNNPDINLIIEKFGHIETDTEYVIMMRKFFCYFVFLLDFFRILISFIYQHKHHLFEIYWIIIQIYVVYFQIHLYHILLNLH